MTGRWVEVGDRLDTAMRSVVTWMRTSPYRGLGWAVAVCLFTIGWAIGMSI